MDNEKLVSVSLAKELSIILFANEILPPTQSHFYYRFKHDDHLIDWQLQTMENYGWIEFLNEVEVVPTYDIDDMLKLLPTYILTFGGYYHREIKSNQVGYYQLHTALDYPELDSVFGYEDNDSDKKLVDALAKLYLWVLNHTTLTKTNERYCKCLNYYNGGSK
jgi:hypothetical protein